MDALVARVERIVAIAERQVGCIPEMFHLADADDGRLLQECSAEYPHQCFDEPGHHALTLADLRAVLAQLEAAKRDSARIDWLENAAAHMHCNYSTPDAFTVGVDCTFLDGGFKVERHGLHLRDVIDSARLATKDAARTPTGAPENG